MNNYIVSVKNKNGIYQQFKVPEEVYVYVKQLEAYIKSPNKSKLKEVYHERFCGEYKKTKCQNPT